MKTTGWALRLTTNYIERSDSIDRQTRLHQCTALVTVGYIVLSIGLFRLASMEVGRQHAYRTTDIQLILTNNQADLGRSTMAPTITDLSQSASVIASSLKRFLSDNRSQLMIKPPSSSTASRRTKSLIVPNQPQKSATNPPLTSATNSPEEVAFSNGGKHGSLSGIANGARSDEAITMLPVETKQDFALLRPIALGNIKPWRLEVLSRIQQVWHPQLGDKPVVVVLHISRDGILIGSQIVSEGSPESCEALQQTLRQVEYPPAPDWYLGRQITYKLTLTPE